MDLPKINYTGLVWLLYVNYVHFNSIFGNYVYIFYFHFIILSGLLNPQAFVVGCGLKALRHVLITSELPLRMAECVLGTLLWMLNNPDTRKLVSFDFGQLASHFTDFNPISK